MIICDITFPNICLVFQHLIMGFYKIIQSKINQARKKLCEAAQYSDTFQISW